MLINFTKFLALAFSLVSMHLMAFEIELEQLIAKMADYVPEQTAISSLEELKEKINQVQVSAGRLERTRQAIDALTGYQFSPELTIRELVANALDAYYYDPNLWKNLELEAKRVEIKSAGRSKLSVRDNGIGMGLHELVFYLLSPNRSNNPDILNNGISGVTGRFGQGFFSIFSFLENLNNKIVLTTKKEDGFRIQATFFRKLSKGPIWVQFKCNKNKRSAFMRGTEVNISSNNLNPASFQSTLEKYFRINERGLIFFNDTLINNHSNDIRIEILPDDGKKLTVFCSQDWVLSDRITLKISVNGILISEFSFNGNYSYRETNIDLPTTTKLTADRETLDFRDENIQNYLLSIAQFAIKSENYLLLNSIYDLFAKDYFAISDKLRAPKFQSHVIPAISYLDGVSEIGGKPVLRFHQNFLSKANLTPLNVLEVPNCWTIPARFKEKHTRTLLHEAGPRKWVFFRDDLDLKNNNNLALINLIYRLQKQKKAGYIPTNLFNLNGINTTEKLPGPYEGSGTDEQFDLGTLLNKTSATVMALVQEKKYNDPKHQPFHIKKYNILYNLFEKYRSKIDPIVFADIFKIIKDTFFSSEAQINDLIILLKLAPNKYGEMRDIINHNNSLKFINSSIKLIAYIIESEMSDGRQIDRRKLIMNIHDLARNLTVNYPNPNFEDYLYLYNNALKYSQNSEWIQVFNSKNPTTNIRKLTELFHSEKRNLEDRKALFNALKHFPCIGNSVDSSPSLIKKMFNYYLLLDPDESFPCIFSRAVELFNTELKRQERLKNVDSELTSLIYEKMHKIKQDGISYNAGWNNFESTILLKLENPSLYRDKIKLLMAFCETFNLMRGFSYSVRGISHDINEENLFRIWEKLLSGEINDAEQRALSKFLATTPSWVNEKTNRSLSGDEYFDLIRPTLSPSLIPIIYPALFGEEKFMQEGISFVGDQLDRLEPIAHHEKVRQILGNDERLIEKNYSLAVDQNPRRYVWLKEMVKNASEAHAPIFAVRVNTDANEQLLVELQDQGHGLSPEEMHYFFVPGYTSKPRLQEDINFGWGFFTLFRDFDEAVIESSRDGIKKGVVYLKKDENNQFLIRESIEENANNFRGTLISLRKLGRASRIAPLEIKAHLLSIVDGFSGLAITFNGQEISKTAVFALGKNPILEVFVTGGLAQFFIHPQGGLFYNGLAHSLDLADYLNHLPSEILLALNKVKDRLAINLKGNGFVQNANRTKFIGAQLQDELRSSLKRAALAQLARGLEENPARFQDLLPYDYYDNFQPIGAGGLNKRDQLGQQIANQFLSSNISLNDLKAKIGYFLIQNNILDCNYNYIPNAVWSDGMLRKIVDDPTMWILVDYFERHIKRMINTMNLQGNSTCSGNADEDFDVSAIPDEHLEKKPALIAFNNFFSAQAKKYLGFDVIIKFYDKNDASSAHAMQGQYEGSPRIIAFNVANSHFKNFESMLQAKNWNHEHYLDIIDSMTHELVHSFEQNKTSTHNQAFFENQERFLQEFFSISDEDIREWNTQLFSTPMDLDSP